MILKYQQGGVFTPPFVVYQPSAPVTTTTTETTSKKEAKKDLGIDLKDVLGLIKDLGGLDGDEVAASEALNQLFTSIEYKLNNPELAELGGFGGTGSIASEYLKIVRLVDNIKRQASEFTKARDTAIANNNLSEAAIDSRGRVMVIGQEGFEWVSPEKYYEEREDKEYSLVTNAELLDYRAKGLGGLAFNTQAIHTVANGMGMKQVTEMISSAINNLGKLSTNEEVSGYIGVTAGELINGLHTYIDAIKKSDGKYTSVEDLYKVGLLLEDQAAQAESALKYIYHTLPTNAKALLKVKSGVGTDLGAVELIASFISSKQSKTSKFTAELVGGPTKETAGVDSKEDDKIKGNFVLQVQAGKGAHRDVFTLNPESAVKMETDMDVYQGVKTPQGDYVGNTSVLKMLQESRLLEIARTNEAYLGNQKVSPEKLKDLLYTEGAFARVEMPINQVTKGPNFELFKLYDEYRTTKQISEQDAKSLLQGKYKILTEILDANGKPKKEYFRPFLVFDVTTTKELAGIKEDNNFVADKESDPVLYKSIIKYLSEANPEKAEEYADLDAYDFLGEFLTLGQYDHVYKGTLYIPIDPNKASAMSDYPISVQNQEESNYQMYNKGYNAPPNANSIK